MNSQNEHLPASHSSFELPESVLVEAVPTGWSKHRLSEKARFSAPIGPLARFDRGTTCRQLVPVRRSLFRTVARAGPADF
jgi:hypothetical protein